MVIYTSVQKYAPALAAKVESTHGALVEYVCLGEQLHAVGKISASLTLLCVRRVDLQYLLLAVMKMSMYACTHGYKYASMSTSTYTRMYEHV